MAGSNSEGEGYDSGDSQKYENKAKGKRKATKTNRTVVVVNDGVEVDDFNPWPGARMDWSNSEIPWFQSAFLQCVGNAHHYGVRTVYSFAHTYDNGAYMAGWCGFDSFKELKNSLWAEWSKKPSQFLNNFNDYMENFNVVTKKGKRIG